MQAVTIEFEKAFKEVAHLSDREVGEMFDKGPTWAWTMRQRLGLGFRERRSAQIGRIRLICQCVAAASRLSYQDMMCRNRHMKFVRPRQMAMWIAHREFGYSLPVIAKGMGKRDHTTVLHGVRVMEYPQNRHMLATAQAVAREIRERHD